MLFVIEKPNPLPGVFGFHEIWHVIVALAALCHFLFMYIYLLPK
ncbi:MAG: hemolysin III family protein [Candidatus Saccharibacteria bacterium]